MGNPNYTKPTPFSKSVIEEFTAWYNSVTFSNNDEEMATLREILSESTLRLNDLVHIRRDTIDEAEGL